METVWGRAVLGILAVAFMAWAGVVWTSAEAVKTGIVQIQVRLSTLEDRIGYFSERLDKHQDSAWHNEAGNSIHVLKAKIEALEHNVHREGR